MSERSVFETIRSQGEQVFNKVAGSLMQNPQFMAAVQKASQGKTTVDKLVGRALKQMNIPTRTEFKRAVARIEALEAELAELKARAAAPSSPRRRTVRKK